MTSLNELLEDLELTIKELSETLISELALREEREYEKELKNQVPEYTAQYSYFNINLLRYMHTLEY